MKAYLDILKKARNGERKENRTGIATLSFTGDMFKHDMREGFPLLTTKKMPPKCIFAELEGFIKGITDKTWFQKRRCTIWDEWCNPKKVPYGNDAETIEKMKAETDLGVIYGYSWGNWYSNDDIVVVPQRKYDDVIVENISNNELYPSIMPSDYVSNRGEKFRIIADLGTKLINNRTRHMCKIQFTDSKYITVVRLDAALDGRVADVYTKSVKNIGYLGENADYLSETYSDEIRQHVYKVWNHMLDRCYDEKCKEYQYYGAKGVTVASRWHNFSLFSKDVTMLSGWRDILRNPAQFELDKDYYASNIYSNETCLWLPHNLNVLYRDGRAFDLYAPDGSVARYISKTKAAMEHGLTVSKLSLVLDGKRKRTKGYSAKYVDDGKIYRYKLPINQLKNAIDSLKTNPTDRRMLVMAWNPCKLDEMALPPCHFGFQFVSDGQFLDLCWFQRSVDTFLGLPFNIASYGMLLELVAKQVGMTPRYLVGHLDDVHVYENQLEVTDIQLSRTPGTLPTIKILHADRADWTIWDWQYTDFELVGYNPQDKLTAEVAV